MKIAHFIGFFLAIYGWIWKTKIILWQSAWKNEENVHLRFFIFQTSLHRSLQNKFRDFQKWWIYEKYENCPFYSLFFGHMVGYDKQKLSHDNKNGIMKKIYISSFNFWNFFTEICAKHTKRFLKATNNETSLGTLVFSLKS